MGKSRLMKNKIELDSNEDDEIECKIEEDPNHRYIKVF
jgi:hypothetical protein